MASLMTTDAGVQGLVGLLLSVASLSVEDKSPLPHLISYMANGGGLNEIASALREEANNALVADHGTLEARLGKKFDAEFGKLVNISPAMLEDTEKLFDLVCSGSSNKVADREKFMKILHAEQEDYERLQNLYGVGADASTVESAILKLVSDEVVGDMGEINEKVLQGYEREIKQNDRIVGRFAGQLRAMLNGRFAPKTIAKPSSEKASEKKKENNMNTENKTETQAGLSALEKVIDGKRYSVSSADRWQLVALKDNPKLGIRKGAVCGCAHKTREAAYNCRIIGAVIAGETHKAEEFQAEVLTKIAEKKAKAPTTGRRTRNTGPRKMEDFTVYVWQQNGKNVGPEFTSEDLAEAYEDVDLDKEHAELVAVVRQRPAGTNSRVARLK